MLVDMGGSTVSDTVAASDVPFESETVNVKLPDDAGKYYFVFNNKFSLVTPKAVQANLTMTCYTR